MKMTKLSVYVYRGLGCSQQSLNMLYDALSAFCDPEKYRVSYISPEKVIQGRWRDDAALIAVGGGFDRGFVKALGDTGVKQIKDYVTSGGKYLGICAGGYFGCEEVEFDKDGPLQVWEKRELKFFEGKCVGAVFPGFEYNSDKGAHSASITWNFPNRTSGNSQTPNTVLYFNGGGKFVPDESATFDVLATYDDLENNPPAVVQCIVGEGAAILSGVHFEYNANSLRQLNDPHCENIVIAMERCTSQRTFVFSTMLSLMGISCVSSQSLQL